MSRIVSGTERAWLVADRIAPPFATSLVVEGEGRLDLEAWTEAVTRAAAVHPGVHLRLAESLTAPRWVPGGLPPRVASIDGSAWDGHGSEGLPEWSAPLDPWHGPVAEVLLVSGRVPRVILRLHHAVMDGRGLMMWVEDVFAALRGDLPTGASAGPETDTDLVASLGRRSERNPPSDAPPPVTPGSGGPCWRRTRVEGRFHRVLATVVAHLGQRAGPDARIDVPVDLRRHRPGLRSTANLTSLVRIPAGDLAGLPDPIGTIADRIARKIEACEEADFVLAADGLRWLPIPWLAVLGRRDALACAARGRWRATANVSNLGRIPSLSGGGFTGRCAFAPPARAPGLPVWLALTGDAEGVEICASAESIGPAALDALLADLALALRASSS